MSGHTGQEGAQEGHPLMGEPHIGSEFVEVSFFVRADTKPDESVYIVGNSPKLGSWYHTKSVPLSTSPYARPVWSATISLPVNTPLQYKYLIRAPSQQDPNILVIRQWESSKGGRNRAITPAGVDMTVDDGQFGQIDGHSDIAVDEGWLHDEIEFRLRLGTRYPFPVQLIDHQPFRVRVSVVPFRADEPPFLMKLNVQSHGLTSTGEPNAMVESMVQPPDGWPWRSGQVVFYHTRLSSLGLKSASVLIEVLQHNENGEEAKLIGSGMVHPVQMLETAGAFPIALSLENRIVGQFMVDYLFVRPFDHPLNNMSMLNAFAWTKGTQLNIGHRGSGTSQRKKNGETRSKITENTVYSFIRAAQAGAEFVEFDVQLTKDRIPIVYHNFKTVLHLERKASDLTLPVEIYVNQLTLASLRTLHIDYTTEPRKMFSKLIRKRIKDILEMSRSEKLKEGSTSTESLGNMSESSSSSDLRRTQNRWKERMNALREQIPTLEEVFKSVPPQVGFNVEVKYPCPKVGKPDKDSWEDRNTFADAILKVIFENANGRRIVISSFDPDICTIFRLKQAFFPVFFLTTAGHGRYGQYRDVRSMTVESAVTFALSERLLGICCFSTPLLEDKKLIPFVKKNNLLLFTWGEDNNMQENVHEQKVLGVDAVISDVIQRPLLSPALAPQAPDLTAHLEPLQSGTKSNSGESSSSQSAKEPAHESKRMRISLHLS